MRSALEPVKWQSYPINGTAKKVPEKMLAGRGIFISL